MKSAKTKKRKKKKRELKKKLQQEWDTIKMWRIKMYFRFLLLGPFSEVRSSLSDRLSSPGKIDGDHFVPSGKFGFEDLHVIKKKEIAYFGEEKW